MKPYCGSTRTPRDQIGHAAPSRPGGRSCGTLCSLAFGTSAAVMSRSDWRARKVNVGSQHPAHTLRDDHDCGDVPPSPLCDDVSPVDSMVVPVLQGHCNSNADSAFTPALDSKVALHSHPVAPRVTACAPPMCTASPLLSDDAPSPLLFPSHEASPHACPRPSEQPTRREALGRIRVSMHHGSNDEWLEKG